jgi:uncharacterized protein
MKVVLDTNVLIDGFKDEYSYAKRIIDEIIAGRVEAFANPQTLRENHFILNKIIANEEYKRELDTFFSKVAPVENTRRIRVVEDPEDNKILESAVVAQADYLVTEDNHLLRLNQYEGVKIIEPAGFWVRYQEETGDDPWQKWVKFVSGK